MEKLLEQLREKVEMWDMKTKESRARRGVYVDCIEMVKKRIEAVKNLVKPDVIKSVCDHKRIYSEVDGFAYCQKCGDYMQ